MEDYRCIMRGGLLASMQEAVRGNSGIKLVYVHGVSGVGKTTLVEEALLREGFGENRESFSFERPVNERVSNAPSSDKKTNSTASHEVNSQFKNYLNNLILIRRARLPFIYRIFSRDFRMEDAHLSAHPPLSFALTVSNRDESDRSSARHHQNLLDVNLSHGRWRLNGSIEVDFFAKLWSGLKMSGCRHLHLGNIEYATAKEREYIFLLSQVTPDDCCLILEFGTLVADGDEDGFRRALELYVHQDARRMILVEPFNEISAQEFHQEMSQGRRLPPFDFMRSRGIPICILNEISIIDSRYSVGGRIKGWLEDPGKRTTLLVLTLLATVTDDRDTIEQVVQDICPGERLDVFSGVVEVGLEFVRFSHASYLAFLETNHRTELRELLFPVIESLSRLDRFAAHVLRLSRGKVVGRGQEAFDTSLVWDVLDLFEDIRFPEIRHLFNAGILNDVPQDTPEFSLLISIEALTRIHDLDSNSFRRSRLSSLPWPIAELIQIYADYQFDRRESSLANAQELLVEVERRFGDTPGGRRESLLKVAGVARIMMGASLVGLGRYDEAREEFKQAQGLSLPSIARGYLHVLDGFVYGLSYQSRLSPYDPPLRIHPYVSAKVAHNIVASRIELGHMSDCKKDLWETSIQPLDALGSREYTYGLNNIAVIDLIEGRYDSAIDVLRSLYDRTYQLYDLCACVNNLICHAFLTGNYQDGTRFTEDLDNLFKDGNFGDPTFKMMSYSNIAAFAWRFGDLELMETALAEAEPPAGHESASFYNEKRATMEAGGYGGTFVIDADEKLLERRYIFSPIVLHHWDFYLPPLDAGMLREWLTLPVRESRFPHG